MAVPVKLQPLAHEQHGVLTRAQVTIAGMTSSAINHQLRRGDWQRVLPRTFLTHGGPLTDQSMDVAAVLYAGKGAMLSHESAGALYGWCQRPLIAQVSVPASRRCASRQRVTVHRVVVLRGDVGYKGALPVASPAFTFIQLLGSAATAGAALALLGTADQSRLIDAEAVLARCGPRVRWGSEIRCALPDVESGSHSASKSSSFAAFVDMACP